MLYACYASNSGRARSHCSGARASGMSQPDESMDKREIAQEEEEREKMLNVENSRLRVMMENTGEEQELVRKIPIGGIKMPGFCRNRSKEFCKEEEGKVVENNSESSGAIPKENAEQEYIANKETKEKEVAKRGIFDAIRVPLVSVFPRKKNKESEVELRQNAGLASVETLEETEKNPLGNEDGMETVRLDDNLPDTEETDKRHFFVACLALARRNLFVIVATLCILLSVIIIICVACVGPRRSSGSPTRSLRGGKYIEAVTSCGPVQGIMEDGGFAFRGIPYALRPIENRRWQPAEPLRRIENCWNGTYPALNSSNVCWQRDDDGNFQGTEDCLYLDVFTPEVRYDSPLPVVVMIGADTLAGRSPGVVQPSVKLARVRDMVFVRPNFRLGIFGFLAAEPLSRSAHPPTSGNYGLSDILAALQWVQLNIENFGGNRKAVTLWGHRAGGTLAAALVAPRRSRELFSRIWISSGGAVFPSRDLDKTEKLSEEFLDNIKCRDAACLRGKTAEELLEAVPEPWYARNTGLPEPREATTRDKRHEWLVLDGGILQEPVDKVWLKDELPVSLVIGTTAHSGAPAKYLAQNAIANSTQVEKIVRESLLGTTGLADEALKRYSSTLPGLASMISDIRVVCPLLSLAKLRQGISFYVVTQPRGGLADVDSDAAAILGSYAATTPAEKRHVSAMQQLFNHYVWHGEVAQTETHAQRRVVLLVGQDTLTSADYPNCEFWKGKDIVPSYGRLD
ncbi:hypothetical protein KM043_013888 [Ampulex compressa]|nr:hypothetical protein KM043_013888 [Ampulex compressa]